MTEQTSKQQVVLQPKIQNFFWVYLITSIPGFIFGMLGLLFICILLISLLLASSASTEGLQYATLKQSSSSNAVLIYDLDGVITSQASQGAFGGGSSIAIDEVKKDFKEIKNNKNIKNIVFRFNSPGGEVYASEVLGDLIQELLDDKGIKEGVFYFDSLAASGALLATYKVDSNYVFGSTYGQTGSIGVRLELPNIAGLADNIGYKQIVIKSGENKDIGNIFRDPTNEELAYFQSQTDTIYNDFVTTVANGRNLTTEQAISLATGLTFFNEDAQQKGLIDEVSNSIDDAVKRAAKNVSLSSYDVLEIEKPVSLFDELGISFGINNVFQFGPQFTQSPSISTQELELKRGVFYAIDERSL